MTERHLLPWSGWPAAARQFAWQGRVRAALAVAVGEVPVQGLPSLPVGGDVARVRQAVPARRGDGLAHLIGSAGGSPAGAC